MPGRDMVSSGPTMGTPEPFQDFLNREHLLPGGVKLTPSAFPKTDAVTVTAAATTAAAVTLNVAALPGAIPSGTTLNFGGNKVAITTSAAAAGATTIPIQPLPTTLAGGETATYTGAALRTIPKATPIGRTITERDASTPFGPADAADDEIFLTAFDIPNADAVGYSGDAEVVRHGTIVKENFIPGWTGLASGLKTALRARYTMIRGSE
jgi:hypothetical protein